MSTHLEKRIEPVKIFSNCVSPPLEVDGVERPPILLQAGLLSTNRTFNGVKYQLSRNTKRKVYSLNLRNHGESEWSDDFTLEHMIADLKFFMDSENIPKAVLVGHSLGGRVLMGFALKYPEMVEKLVVEDMSLKSSGRHLVTFKKSFSFGRFLWHTTCQLPLEMTEKEAQKRMLPLVQSFWPKANYNDIQYMLPFHKDKSGKFVWDMNMEVVLNLENNLHLIEMDLTNNPVYEGETLMLGGSKSDIQVQEDMDEIRRYFPKAECIIIENGYHAYHQEQQNVYVHHVSKFIGVENC